MKRFLFLAASFLSLNAAGCGAKVAVDGDGATDGGTSTKGTCDDACGRVAPACGEDLALCTQLCEANATQAEANGCKSQNDALVDCIANAPDDVVCGSGMNVPASCQPLYDAWDACTP